MLRLLLAVALLPLGCATTIPVYAGASTDAERALIEEGASLLGYGVDWRTKQYGAMTIDIVQKGSTRVLGRSNRGFCRRYIWAVDVADVVSHEIGHALGLGHVSDEENVMYYTAEGDEVEDWQLEDSARGLRRLRVCGGQRHSERSVELVDTTEESHRCSPPPTTVD